MTETLTLDEGGRLVLTDAALRLLSLKPGSQLRANVTAKGIEILPEQNEEPQSTPEVRKTVLENGVLVLAPTGIEADIAAAVRYDRDDLAARAIPR